MIRYGKREWAFDPKRRDPQDMIRQGRGTASRSAVSKRVRGMKYTWLVDRMIGNTGTYWSYTSTNRGREYVTERKVGMTYMRKGELRVDMSRTGGFPHTVSMRIDTVDGSGLKALAGALLARPAAASKIAAGQMPDDIEKVFAAAGLRLLPDKSNSTTRCTCGNQSEPCGHVVAAFFLLADIFERDPFQIFRLHGFKRGDLLRAAGLRSARRVGSKSRRRGMKRRGTEALPADPDAFWGADHGTHDHWDASIPAIHAVLPKHLGRFPLWRGEEDFVGAMEHIYSRASQEGMRVLRGEIDLGPVPSPYS